jgi:NodT family efflux transporter outer membrane factor (OMF) lipoprotein
VRILSAAAILLGACAVGPNFHRPAAPRVDRFTEHGMPSASVDADGIVQRFHLGARITRDWWRLFHSAALDRIVARAMADNQSIQAALASLARSQDLLRAGYGIFFPQLDADLRATRQRFVPSQFGSPAPASVFNFFTAEGTVSYTLDLFGGQRRTVESLRAEVDVERWTLAGAYLMLTSNVASTVIARAGYRAQIDATNEFIRSLKEQVRITSAQAEAGTVPYANVLSITTQLDNTSATLPPLEQKLSQTEHLLATLEGHTPAEGVPGEIKLEELTLPADLPLTLPSAIVRSRPDILVAEAQLHDASAKIGVATAAMFPNITLNGGYGVNSSMITSLFQPANIAWSIGASLTQPIFHGGTLYYQRRAAIEGYHVALHQYEQTVLTAFQQVADALRALEHDAQTVVAAADADKASSEALRLVEIDYKAGTASYLQVLIADVQWQQARISHIQAVTQRMQDTVALFVALGGGWWN